MKQRLSNQDWLIKAIIILSITSFLLTIGLFASTGFQQRYLYTIQGVGINGVRFDAYNSDLIVLSHILEDKNSSLFQDYYDKTWDSLMKVLFGRNATGEEVEQPTLDEYNNNKNALVEKVNETVLLLDEKTKAWNWVEFWLFFLLSIIQVINIIFVALLAYADRHDIRNVVGSVSTLNNEIKKIKSEKIKPNA